MNECDLIQIRFVDRIFVEDWPLQLLDNWINGLAKDDYILPIICETFDKSWNINMMISKSKFRNMLFSKKPCKDSSICRDTCSADDHCFTTGRVIHLLVSKDLRKYLVDITDIAAQREILVNFFDKISFKFTVPKSRTRLGVLLLGLTKTPLDEFTKMENDSIIKQLASKFFVSMSDLIHADHLFKFMKRSIDCVVIVVDSLELDYAATVSSIIKQFSYLTIFLVRTVDSMTLNDEAILGKYRPLFPRNRVLIYDWLKNPNGFIDFMADHSLLLKRFTVALSSFFVQNKV